MEQGRCGAVRSARPLGDYHRAEGASMSADDRLEPSRAQGLEWFGAWALIGAIGGLGLVSFGLLAIVPAGLLAWLVASKPAARRSGFGFLAGLGLVSLFVAYVQRRGPGTICWHTADASGCDQYLDPRPWLVVGLALVVAGVILHIRRTHSSSDHVRADPTAHA